MNHTAMSHTSLRRRIVLLCVELAAALALLWLAPASVATWRRWKAPAPQPPALDEYERAALTPRAPAGVQQPTLQRPLFTPTRRPPPKEVEAPPPAAPAQVIEQAQLRGFVDAGGVSGALVELDGTTYFVHVGEELPGTDWRLTALQGRAAHFESKGSGRHVLELPFLENLGAPPAPPAAAQGRRS